MARLVKQKHLKLYKTYLTQLIKDLGQTIILYFPQVDSQCPNCIYDTVHKCSSGRYNSTGPKPFTRGICPVCKGAGTLNTTITKQVTAIVRFGENTDTDEKLVGPAGEQETNFLTIKTFIKHYDDLRTCKYITAKGHRWEVMNTMKRGLKEDIVVVAIAERVE